MSVSRSKEKSAGCFGAQARMLRQLFSRPKVSPESKDGTYTTNTSLSQPPLKTKPAEAYSQVGILDDIQLICKMFLHKARQNKREDVIVVEYGVKESESNERQGDREKTLNNLKEILPSLRLLFIDFFLEFSGSKDTGADLLMELKKQDINIYNPEKQVVVFHSDTPGQVCARLDALRQNGAMASSEHYLIANKGMEKAEVQTLIEMPIDRIKKLAQIQFIEYQQGRDSSLSTIFAIEETLTSTSLEVKSMPSDSIITQSGSLFSGRGRSDNALQAPSPAPDSCAKKDDPTADNMIHRKGNS